MVIKINYIKKKDLLTKIESLQEEVKHLKEENFVLAAQINDFQKDIKSVKENINLNVQINKEILEQRKEQTSVMKEWLFGEEEGNNT
jgi:predicted RNase H-like nuclease (RuvC/YqgF family)